MTKKASRKDSKGLQITRNVLNTANTPPTFSAHPPRCLRNTRRRMPDLEEYLFSFCVARFCLSESREHEPRSPVGSRNPGPGPGKRIKKFTLLHLLLFEAGTRKRGSGPGIKKREQKIGNARSRVYFYFPCQNCYVLTAFFIKVKRLDSNFINVQEFNATLFGLKEMPLRSEECPPFC